MLSCRAPHVAGSCWFVSEEEEEEEGPLLNLWGGDGAPFSVGGEWFIPLGTTNGRQKRYLSIRWARPGSLVFKRIHLPPTSLLLMVNRR